jgi:hypothetical protein
MVDRGGMVTDKVLGNKASQLGKHFGLKLPDSFDCSNGWLYESKKRFNVCCFHQKGEAGSADAAGVTLACEHLANLLSRFPFSDEEYIEFSLANIFN